MESLPHNTILEFKADTLQFIRKQYDLEKLERLNEAINILEEWLKKQNHFEVKVFDRSYLERVIINNKGSLEKCKTKLDKLCTLRTLLPEFFAITVPEKRMLDIFAAELKPFLDFPWFILKQSNLKKKQPIDIETVVTYFQKAFRVANATHLVFSGMRRNEKESFRWHAVTALPKMTPDFGRVCMVRVTGDHFETNMITSYFKYYVALSEYMLVNDYSNNLTFFIDWTDINILAFAINLNMIDVRKCFDIFLDGHSLRVKGIHMLTESKTVEAVVTVLKQLLSEKLFKRMYVHRSLESLYLHIPKEVLPAEYGGNEPSIYQLCDKTAVELSSDAHVARRKELNKARTNEAYRSRDKFNEEYMGVSGTFRNLSVD